MTKFWTQLKACTNKVNVDQMVISGCDTVQNFVMKRRKY